MLDKEKNSNLCCFDKYYIVENGNYIFFDNFNAALDYKKIFTEKILIDYSSVFSVLAHKFMIGDRTLISGIFRTPWLSKFGIDSFLYEDIPKHGNELLSINEISSRLFFLLKEELKKVINNSRRVGILLSGGMDSRIVAGILIELIKTNEIKIDKVIAYTWGELDSRDYVYAKRIAENYGWDFKHYLVGEKDVWENMETSAKRGCEYSGIHLHAMPRIGKDSAGKVDLILAGSYGDSIGRAEFSGIHATKLKDMTLEWGNFSSLLGTYKNSEEKNNYLASIFEYRTRFGEREKWQIFELEKQCHYMRRMLNPCMETISDITPLYQAFTDFSVYSFIWNLHSNVRGDEVYFEILKKIDPFFSTIPWARTGLIYGKNGIPDNLKKSHHLYSNILNNKLLDLMMDTINASPLLKSSKSLNNLYKEIKLNPKNNFDFLERFTYLTSLALFTSKTNIMFNENILKSNFFDSIFTSLLYKYKTIIRDLKNK